MGGILPFQRSIHIPIEETYKLFYTGKETWTVTVKDPNVERSPCIIWVVQLSSHRFLEPKEGDQSPCKGFEDVTLLALKTEKGIYKFHKPRKAGGFWKQMFPSSFQGKLCWNPEVSLSPRLTPDFQNFRSGDNGFSWQGQSNRGIRLKRTERAWLEQNAGTREKQTHAYRRSNCMMESSQVPKESLCWYKVFEKWGGCLWV